MNTDLIPVFLGADLNCYNFARAFHEAYGVESYAFGRYAMAPTKYSKIVHFTIVPDIDNESTMLRVLHDFAKQHPGKKLYLFGCTDDYAAMIIRRKAELPEYIAPGPAADLYGSIQKKAEFYEVCDKFGIPYPTTKVLTAPTDAAELTEDKLGFAYPIIVKPSSSVAYWKFPFDGMKKVYTAADPTEAASIVKQIYDSGYPDKMILQEMIPGGDDHMRVLTAFSDENGKVRAMCLGHTMVEEHTPHGLGNHAAIVAEDTTALPLVENIRQMLEACHYTGFSNFDIKWSGKPGDFRVFEINLRQGRTGGGKVERRRQRLRAEPQRGVLAPRSRPGSLYLHRGQKAGSPCQRAESPGQRSLFPAVQTRFVDESHPLRLCAGTAAPPVQEVQNLLSERLIPP